MTQHKSTSGNVYAIARALNLPVSTKQCVEISHELRLKSTGFAKKYLEHVVSGEQAVPFHRHTKDMGHKPGMSAGRFPQKAAAEFLHLIKTVEANARVKGLGQNLRIVHLTANKASIPSGGGRHRYATKRTHLEVKVGEERQKKSMEKKVDSKKADDKKADSVHAQNTAPVAPAIPAVPEEYFLRRLLFP